MCLGTRPPKLRDCMGERFEQLVLLITSQVEIMGSKGQLSELETKQPVLKVSAGYCLRTEL